MAKLLKLSDDVVDENMSVVKELVEKGVLVVADLDNEFIEREIDYYVDNEESELKYEEKCRNNFRNLLRQEYENITDNEYISSLWERVKSRVESEN